MNIAVVLPSVLLGHAIDTVLAYRRGQVPGSAVTTAALLLIGGSAATELPRVGKRWWLGVARTRICASVRADALRGVLSWPADQLHTTSVGEVMARIIGDVEVLGTGAGEVITETWDTLLFSLSLAVAMFVYDPELGALALVPVPFALALAKLAGSRVSRRTLRARQANAAVTAFAQEGLAGVRVLHACGRRAAWTGRMSVLASAQADAELAATRLDAVLAPLYGTLTTAGIVAVIWLGGTRVAAGTLSTGDLVAFLGLFARFTGRAYRIPQMANRVQAAAAALTRLSPLARRAPASGRRAAVRVLPPGPRSGDGHRRPRRAGGAPAGAGEGGGAGRRSHLPRRGAPGAERGKPDGRARVAGRGHRPGRLRQDRAGPGRRGPLPGAGRAGPRRRGRPARVDTRAARQHRLPAARASGVFRQHRQQRAAHPPGHRHPARTGGTAGHGTAGGQSRRRRGQHGRRPGHRDRGTRRADLRRPAAAPGAGPRTGRARTSARGCWSSTTRSPPSTRTPKPASSLRCARRSARRPRRNTRPPCCCAPPGSPRSPRPMR